jgi:hypothetical protein
MEEINKSTRRAARLAGFLFLWLIITGLAGELIISKIVGSGTFPEKAKRVVESEHLYRLALCTELIETMSAALLAFALYVTLKPVNKLLAQLAMYWRLGESFIGGTGVILGFSELGLYTSSNAGGQTGIAQAQLIEDMNHHAGFAVYNISALFFSIGSLLFFYLFTNRVYSRVQSFIGLFAYYSDDHVLLQPVSRTTKAPVWFWRQERSHNIWLMLLLYKTIQ